SRGPVTDSFLRRFPIRELRFTLVDLALALIEQLLLPIGNRNLLLVSAEIIPKRFNRVELFHHCHPIHWQHRIHELSLRHRCKMINSLSGRSLGEGGSLRDGGSTPRDVGESLYVLNRSSPDTEIAVAKAPNRLRGCEKVREALAFIKSCLRGKLKEVMPFSKIVISFTSTVAAITVAIAENRNILVRCVSSVAR